MHPSHGLGRDHRVLTLAVERGVPLGCWGTGEKASWALRWGLLVTDVRPCRRGHVLGEQSHNGWDTLCTKRKGEFYGAW